MTQSSVRDEVKAAEGLASAELSQHDAV
eukprot:COSAG06_NODE_60884_length_269_cov_0.911765_1_plen_27_part_10